MTVFINTLLNIFLSLPTADILLNNNRTIAVVVAIIIIIIFSTISIFLSKHIVHRFYLPVAPATNHSTQKPYFLHNYTCEVLNTLPCTTVIYDCDGNPLFCNNKTYDLIAPNGLDLIPNLFESTIISSEHLTNAKEGKNVEGTAYLNFNDQRVEKIFGKNIERETVFKYHLESLVDSATKTTNYILSIYNITHQYIEEQRTKNILYLLRECLNMTKTNAYLYDVKSDVFFRLQDTEMVKTQFKQDIIFKQIAPKYRPQFIETFLRLKSGEISTDRRRYPILAMSTNRYYFVETNFYAVSDVSGNIKSILLCTRNVSQDSERQSELENLKDILTKALPVAQMRAWTYNHDTKCFTISNAESEKTISYSGILETINPEDRTKFKNAYNQMISGEISSIRITIRILFDEKPDRMCEIYCSSKKANADYTNIITGIIVDCTELYQTRYYLDSIKGRTTAIARMMHKYIIDYNSTDKIFRVFSNHSVKEFNSITTHLRLFAPENRDEMVKLEENIVNCAIEQAELNYKYMHGKEYENFSIVISAYDYINGKPSRYCGIITRECKEEKSTATPQDDALCQA